MSEIVRTSFYYSPIRQGYDTNSWRTISGAPAVAGSGRIVVDAGAGIPGVAIHYADFLKGDISFNVNIPSAPAGGDMRYFGVAALNTGAYIRFAIDDALTFQTSNGTTSTESSEVTWDTALTGANTEFRIRWEPGTAKFYINGSLQYTVTDASVPCGPLSLYLYDNSSTAMTIGDMNVRGTQSFVMNPKTSDSNSTSFDGTLSINQSVTVTESVLINYSLPSPISDSVTVSENIKLAISLPSPLYDSITVSEGIQISYSLPSDINDSITVTEGDPQISYSLPSDISDSVTISEDGLDIQLVMLTPEVFDSVTVTDIIDDIDRIDG